MQPSALSLTQVLHAGTSQAKLPFQEFLEAQAQGHASPLGSSQLPLLDSLVSVVEQWLQRCGKAIARRSAQTLKTCLEAMAASVQRAQEQMESQLRKLQASTSVWYKVLVEHRDVWKGVQDA